MLCLHSEPKPDVSIELPGEECVCSTGLYELRSKFGRVPSGNERLFVRVEVATILATYSSSSTSWSSYLHLYFVFRCTHILRTGSALSLLLELEFTYLTLSSWGSFSCFLRKWRHMPFPHITFVPDECTLNLAWASRHCVQPLLWVLGALKNVRTS